MHLPNLLIKNIFKYSKKLKYLDNLRSNTISVILPCLNEEKILKKALSKICNISLFPKNLSLELILVDGGSKDRSIKIAQKFKKLKIYSLNNSGRGFAINYGIQKAKGDIIAIFPTDNEYDVEDLKNMIKNIIDTRENVIFGSRLIKMCKFIRSNKKSL